MGINFDKSQQPAQTSTTDKSWGSNEVHTVHIGSMLAKILVVPENTDHVVIRLRKGDEELFNKLQATLSNGTLSLACELPYKDAATDTGTFGGVFRRSRRGGISVNSGNVIIGGASGSVSVNGLNIQVGGASGHGSILIINGREVDLSNQLEIELVVPTVTNIEVAELIGNLTISHNLEGWLRLAIDSNATIKTEVVAKLNGTLDSQSDIVIAGIAGDCDFEIGGQGSCTIGAVAGNANVELASQGSFRFGSITGKLEAVVSGQGSIMVKEGSSVAIKARVSSQGSIRHRGTITTNASLRVTGMGDINVKRVLGEVDARVTGMGEIVANGKTYRR